MSWQPVRPYLMFVTTEASLLVKKANEILRTASNTSQGMEAASYPSLRLCLLHNTVYYYRLDVAASSNSKSFCTAVGTKRGIRASTNCLPSDSGTG